MSERSWDKEVVPRAANKQKRDLDKMGKGNLIDIPRENQSRPENKSGSANNIIPGASLSRAFNTPPPPLQSGKSISLAIGGIGDGKYNERFHSKAHFGADCIIPGSSTPPSFEASLQKTDAIVSDQASPKGKVKISVQKILSSQTLEPKERQQNLSKPCIEPTRAPFSCDICNKGFSSRQARPSSPLWEAGQGTSLASTSKTSRSVSESSNQRKSWASKKKAIRDIQ